MSLLCAACVRQGSYATKKTAAAPLRRLLTVSKRTGCDARQALKILIEKTRVRKIKLFSDVRNGQITVLEHYFRLSYNGTIYPFFGIDAAFLLHYATEIRLRDAQLSGIEGEVVLITAILIDKQNKTIKELTRV